MRAFHLAASIAILAGAALPAASAPRPVRNKLMSEVAYPPRGLPVAGAAATLPPLPPPMGGLRPRPKLPPPKTSTPTCAPTLQQCDEKVYCFPQTNSACLQAAFFDHQAWRVCIYTTEYFVPLPVNEPLTGGPSKGLAIGPVDFYTPQSGWQRVVYTAETAEIFTGYDDLPPNLDPSKPSRLYDTRHAHWSKFPPTYDWSLNALTPDHVPADGKLITLARDGAFGPRVAAECRDRGIAWLCHGLDRTVLPEPAEITNVRRGEELVLWGVFDTGNYDIITEYGFRDDGTIAFRTGATGYNNTTWNRNGICVSADPSCGEVPHVHDVLWRVDVDVNGGEHDAVTEVRHKDGDPPKDQEQPFNGGVEGALDWKPEQFTSILVEDVSHTDLHGHHPGYEVHPLRFGNARQQLEPWAAHDFWVTRWYFGEDIDWAGTYKTPDEYLDAHIQDSESITDADVVLWYLATAHHHPTDEDRQPNGFYGVTLVHYFGFELTPHNLFPANPLGAPEVCEKY